ncbi:MAG: 30S ribosomal protein S9 [Cytophagales bacterium]|nr:30S ribosomal protein S9 [Cytophagales bacterium]
MTTVPDQVIHAVGRRKTSVARLYLSPGKGKVLLNGRDLKDYFPYDVLQIVVLQPLSLLRKRTHYDLRVNVHGGGFKAQAESIRLALVRALCQVDVENRPPLKEAGWVTRDPRMVERKKYGRRKARRKFQFSKR